jgi:hypothetical protein
MGKVQIAEILSHGPPDDAGLAHQFAKLEAEIGKRVERANLAA